MSKVVKVIAMVVVAAAIIVFAPQIAGFLATLGATSVTAGAVAAAGIGLAISTALSVAMSFFVKPPSLTNAMIDRLNSSIQPTAPRKIVFGRTAAGNDIRYFEEHGKNDHYTQVIALASHRIEALRQYYMEEELTWENNNVQGEFESGVRFLRYVKEGNSSNFQEVGTGENWKPTATFTGCAYSVVSFRLKNDVFEKGFPSKTTWVVDGCPLYDPRRDSTRGGVGAHRINDQNSWRFYDGAVEIGRNPALALAVYLTGYRINGKLVWGMGVPADRIDWDSIRDYANLCEERVATQSGSTIQRYTADGIFSTADSHESVISALTAAMGSCKLTDVGGRYTIIGGYDDTLGPTIDFTADHLVAAPGQPAPYSWIPAPPARETYNIARGRFSDPANQYQLADWGAIETDPLPDGVPRTMQIDLGMVSRSETCQRIAKQFLLREALTPGHFAGTFGPLAFAATVGSLVTLSLPQEGWNRKLFRVIEQAETHDLLFQMTLREEDPAVYAWDREEKPLPPSIRPPGYKASLVYAPADLDVTSQTVSNADGVETSEVTVTWTPEDSGQVRAIQIESRPDGTDAWTEQAAQANPETGSFAFMSNRPAASLDVRARFRMFSGVYSGWSYHNVQTAPVAIVDGVARGTANAADTKAQQALDALVNKVTVDNVAPNQITGVSASSVISDNGAKLTVTWTASSATDLAGYVVAIKEGSGTFLEYATTAARYEWDGLKRNQAYSVQVRAYDKSGNFGSFSTLVSHTTASDTVAPALPTGLSATASFQNIYLKWTNPADSDLAGVEVYENTANSSATAAKIVTVNALPGQDGAFARSGLTSGVQRYYWLKAVDSSGNKSAFTAAINATTASVSETDFTPTASGIAPLKLVSTLPTSGNFDGRLVYLSTDKKLYRYNGTAWTSAVPSTDISGQLTDAQLSAISAAKVSGQLTNSQIADVAASKLTGQVVATQIADGAVNTAKFAAGIEPVEILGALPSSGNFQGRIVLLTTDSKLYRYTGSSWTASVASTDISGQLTDAQLGAISAAKLTGQITSTQITDDAITTPKIAAGAVTASEIAANTITAAEIASGTITATEIAASTITGSKIAANTITASNIAADTITAGQIAAGAISTSELGAGAVTASKVFIGDTSNMIPDPTCADLQSWSINAGQTLSTAATGFLSAAQNRLLGSTTTLDSNISTTSIGVEAGKDYYLKVSVGSHTGSSVTVRAYVDWYSMDASGALTYISGDLIISPVATTTNVTSETIYKAPANARVAKLVGHKLASSTAGALTLFNPVMRRASSGELIVDGSISAGKVAAGAITTAKLAAGAVTANEIAADSVTTGKIAAGAVTANEIAASTITAAKIASATITATQIAGSTITGTKIAANTITGGNIAADTITTGNMAAGAITATEIASGAITASKVGIRGENLWPDSQCQDISWWKGPSQGTLATAGYVNPTNNSNIASGGWEFVPSGLSAYADRVGGSKGMWQLWSNGTAAFTGTAITQIVPPSMYAKSGTTYEFSVGCWNASNKQIAFVVQYFKADGTNSATSFPILLTVAAGDQTTKLFKAKFTVPTDTVSIRIYAETPSGAAFSGAINVGNFTLREAASGTMIVDGSITTSHMTANSIDGDRITAGTLAVTKLETTGSLPATLTVGSTGATLATVQSQANNPAARINATTTLIDPGKITISGSTTLANWRNGGDSTKIEGGSIAANTITANKIRIGSRGVNTIAIDFYVSGNQLRYDGGGYVLWMDDNNNPQSTQIAAFAHTDGNNWLYVYWTKGSGSFGITTDWGAVQGNQDNVMIGQWHGGKNWVANYGGTIIDGGRIFANSITANQLSTGQLLTNSAQIGDGLITNAKIGNLQVDTVKIAGNAVTVPVSAFAATTLGLPDGVWTTVQQASITSSGAPIFIAAGHSMEVEPATDRDVDYRILRDGVIIYQIDDISFSTYMASADWALHNITVTDTPGAGAHTYQFQAKTNDGASSRNRSIFLLETKR